MKTATAIEKLPLAEKVGNNNKVSLFRVSGRSGLWKYFNGRNRPAVTRTNQAHHVIAKVVTPKGRLLVREFIKVRKYQIAGDGMILDLLRAGRVRVESHTGRVFSLVEMRDPTNCRLPHWRPLTEYEDSKGKYLFVRLYRGNFRKKIAVHRLVVMADIDSVIPEGFDVDHRNKDFRDNRLENLRLLAS